MKALTICQPYAELILRGEKLVENRTWSPPLSLIGQPLLIHAGKSRSWLDTYAPLPEKMDFGCLVGICVMAAALPARRLQNLSTLDHRWRHLVGHVHAEGPWCWILEDVRRFAEPIPYSGAQGVFDVPEATVQKAMAELAS